MMAHQHQQHSLSGSAARDINIDQHEHHGGVCKAAKVSSLDMIRIIAACATNTINISVSNSSRLNSTLKKNRKQWLAYRITHNKENKYLIPPLRLLLLLYTLTAALMNLSFFGSELFSFWYSNVFTHQFLFKCNYIPASCFENVTAGHKSRVFNFMLGV